MPKLLLPAPGTPRGLAVDQPRLDPQRLDCYRVAVEFQALSVRLLPRRGCGALRDQLDRASTSIVLNIAESCGRVAPADRARFFAIARGSAMECGAILDLVTARNLAHRADLDAGRRLLVRLAQMLTKLVARLAP